MLAAVDNGAAAATSTPAKILCKGAAVTVPMSKSLSRADTRANRRHEVILWYKAPSEQAYPNIRAQRKRCNVVSTIMTWPRYLLWFNESTTFMQVAC